jgi:act minimal PKS acyl carrier protein
MREFTLADLTRIMRASVGVDDSIDLDADIMDTTFTDLGYDSLATLEIASKVDLEFGTKTPEGMVSQLETPRQFVDHINQSLAVSAV